MQFSLFYEVEKSANKNIYYYDEVETKKDYDKYASILKIDKKHIPFLPKYKYFIMICGSVPIALFSFKSLHIDDAGNKYANIRIVSNYNPDKLNYYYIISRYLVNNFKFKFLITTVHKNNEKLKNDFIKFGHYINDKDENYNERRLHYLDENKTMLIHYK